MHTIFGFMVPGIFIIKIHKKIPLDTFIKEIFYWAKMTQVNGKLGEQETGQNNQRSVSLTLNS